MALPRDCFYPDGSPAVTSGKGPRMVPCLPTLSDSPCCATNDTCLSNGMCVSNLQFFYRGACTSTLFPGVCPQHCIRSDEPATSFTGYQPLTICQDLFANLIPGQEVFTCSTNNSLCATGNFSLPPSVVTAWNITGFPVNTTTNSTSPPSSSSSGVSTTDLVVAVVVPIVVLLALGGFLWWREHRKRLKAEGLAKDWEGTAQRAQMAQMTTQGQEIATQTYSLKSPVQRSPKTPGPFEVETPMSELGVGPSPVRPNRPGEGPDWGIHNIRA